jgi:hypothetical protein
MRTAAAREHHNRLHRQLTAARIARLPRRIMQQLDGAPLHVLRWAAWSTTTALRDTRATVALMLRRPSPRGRGWRWPSDLEKSATSNLLLRLAPLGPGEIPLAVLEAAIAVRYAQAGKRPASPNAERIMRHVAELEHERDGLAAKLAAIVKPR